VVLVPPADWPALAVNGVESRWLLLRLRHQPQAAAPVSTWRPPRVAALGILVDTGPQAVTAAHHDSMALDISKDFFPFGERPRFGAIFRAFCPAFSLRGARVEVLVQLTNPEGATEAPIPPVGSEGRPTVVWDIARTSGFQPVTAEDGTHSLTRDGSLIFTVPDDVATTILEGKSGSWLRARLASGSYGGIPAPNATTVPVMRAPAIRSLAVRSTLEASPLQPEYLISRNGLTQLSIDPRIPTPVDVFPAFDVAGPVLYIGLGAIGPPSAFDVLAKDHVISWLVRPSPPAPPIVLDEPASGTAVPCWQLRSAGGWRDATVHDDTDGLTRSGIVRINLPEDPDYWRDNMVDSIQRRLVWLRVVWSADESSSVTPQLPLGITINSAAVRHSQRLRNEVVGSSNGRKDQVFKALRTPIIDDVLLQVRETDDDWVTWHETDTLMHSKADSRHFTLDRSAGELRFGDGRYGRIPPQGANNVRLNQYTSGGGRLGNQPAKAISQMRSALPAVESVVNLEPAVGGLDTEDAASVRDHASAWLRHRNRAVCADDFEDLVLRASPQVAHAFCIAGRDLGAVASAGMHGPEMQPGVVSVIVVPWSTDPCPQPSPGLLALVKKHLDARRALVGRLVVVGPTYAHAAVKVRIAPLAEFSAISIARECERRIAEFLHPLTGASDGRGWALDQRPHRSDLYGLLDTVEGVDFVHGLSVSIDVPPGMPIIVAAGAIEVEPVSEP
jgi:predicted phage baseplate assembly protein